MSAVRLLLVRHGETLANREFRYLGARDDALSEVGERQAVQLADALSILPVAAVISSPLQRAFHTAVPVAVRHQLPVTLLEALRECSFGSWEGLSRAEVIARGPADEQRLHAWEHDPTIAPAEGESFLDVQKRVLQAVETLYQQYAGKTLVLVSHVGPIKVLLCSALNAPLSSMFQLFLDPATISVIDWHPSRPVVRLFNSHAHLGWESGRWMVQ